jgi:hypothetical protein
MIPGIKDRIFRIEDDSDFWEAALEINDYQVRENDVFRKFITGLERDHLKAVKPSDIRFLPVSFFKKHKIITSGEPVEMIFESSRTTGTIPGKHFVTDLSLYEESFLSGFRHFYGNPGDYMICALLPSYAERKNSSLAYMADKLIRESHHPGSGFYRGNFEDLIKIINRAMVENQKILLLGVSFALLDLAEAYSPDFSGVIVMETGGMKGRRTEIPRQELHAILKQKFNLDMIHSEYGMTELLSQAYSLGQGLFYCPPWMRIVIRDPQDPLFIYSETGKTGGINIIDLANVNSCSFIATDDLGRIHDDGGFEVLGRFDNSDIRGCNLMAE